MSDRETMPYREKVIKGLKEMANDQWLTRHADYYSMIAEEALEVLKEQEPKKLRCIRRLTKVMKGICPACEMEIESVIHGRITKFCKYCGQAVKWDDK
jgi:hypothetical protein